MKILKKEREILQKMINNSHNLGQYYGEIKKIKDGRRKKLIEKVILTKEQKKEIDYFYIENYGKKIKYDWHRLYTSYTGKFDKMYFPEILYSTKLEPLLNPYDYRKVLDDKLLLDVYIHNVNNVRIPNKVAYSYYDVNCDMNNNIISKNVMAKLIFKHGDVIIKPSQDTNSGIGVQCINKDNYKNEKDIFELISSLNYPFIVQERVKQCKELNKLNPSSVNTFRIITYLLNGKIYHVGVILRIGRNGSIVDNSHAGGIFINVSDDGMLGKTAFSEFQEKFEMHPDTKIRFENYRIPQMKELINCAYKMHLNCPQLGVISWDFTIDENNVFVLIEANTQSQSFGLPQRVGKSVFGENTAAILKLISKRRKK